MAYEELSLLVAEIYKAEQPPTIEDEAERLPIVEIDDFEQSLNRAQANFVAVEDDFGMYGDVTYLTGERVVIVRDRAERVARKLTQAGIAAGYLSPKSLEL